MPSDCQNLGGGHRHIHPIETKSWGCNCPLAPPPGSRAPAWLVGLVGVNASATARVIQGGEMMMKKSVFWWRKPEYPEDTIGSNITPPRDSTTANYTQTIPQTIIGCISFLSLRLVQATPHMYLPLNWTNSTAHVCVKLLDWLMLCGVTAMVSR